MFRYGRALTKTVTFSHFVTMTLWPNFAIAHPRKGFQSNHASSIKNSFLSPLSLFTSSQMRRYDLLFFIFTWWRETKRAVSPSASLIWIYTSPYKSYEEKGSGRLGAREYEQEGAWYWEEGRTPAFLSTSQFRRRKRVVNFMSLKCNVLPQFKCCFESVKHSNKSFSEYFGCILPVISK